MATPSRFWADRTTLDFERLRASGVPARTIAHLPAELPVLFLPTQAVGLSPEHARFPGTLTLKNETILRLWTDIGESVAAAGISKLVLFNSHGGHVSVMDLVARDLRARLDMLVYSVSWFNLPLMDAQGRDVNALFSAEEHRFGIHGGDIETSMMLALDPTRVDMAQARNFASKALANPGLPSGRGGGRRGQRHRCKRSGTGRRRRARAGQAAD